MTFFERNATTTFYKHWEGSMDADYIYTSGVAGERFFVALRDEGKLLATVCIDCKKTYLPPRMYCETCMVELAKWKEVKPTGKVEAFTVLRLGIDGTPIAEPEVRALIRFTGVTGGLVHRVLADPRKVKSGLKVKMQLRPQPERTGTVNDIEGFVPTH